MSQLDEIRAMQQFLNIQTRPITIYHQEDDRHVPSYEEWLNYYAKDLRNRCEQKLVADYYANLGKNLFKAQFSSFQEFQLQ